MNEYTLEISLYSTSIAALHTAIIWNYTPLQIAAFEVGFFSLILIAYVSIKIGDL